MKRWMTGSVVVIAVVAVLAWISIASSTNRKLTQRGIPPLPSSATMQGFTSGGMFSAWLFIAATMDAEDYASYRTTIGSLSDRSYAVPLAAVVIDGFGESSDEERKVFRKQTLNGAPLAWWTIERISHGTVSVKDLKEDCRYTIYFDDDRRMVFIYWSYS